MRSGCINYILSIGTAVVASILLTTGALVLVFGAFNLNAAGGFRTVVTVIVALAAIYVLTRVGKDILRDLRGGNLEDKKDSPSNPPD